MKREALQPAQQLPCPTHPSGTAGHSWLAHGVKNTTSFTPKTLKLECKSLAEASSCTILQKKKKFNLMSSTASQGQELQQARKEHLPWERQAELGGLQQVGADAPQHPRAARKNPSLVLPAKTLALLQFSHCGMLLMLIIIKILECK